MQVKIPGEPRHETLVQQANNSQIQPRKLNLDTSVEVKITANDNNLFNHEGKYGGSNVKKRNYMVVGKNLKRFHPFLIFFHKIQSYSHYQLHTIPRKKTQTILHQNMQPKHIKYE